MRFRSLLSTIAFLWILTSFITVPTVQTSPETYGPHLDQIIGRFIESPSAQQEMLYAGKVDYWPNIGDPQIIRNLEDDGFNVVLTPEAFLFYHIDFNVRDQWGNGTHVQCKGGGWTLLPRGPLPRDASYYSYLGTKGGGENPGGGDGYAPLNVSAFRHACAHLIPKEEIVATVYGGILAAAINSLVPAAQKAWHNPDVDGHPYSRAEAISILEAAGFVFDPDAPNPAPKHSATDPDGNWIDPLTGEPMNYIQFAGVTQASAPDSWAADDMCGREFRAIGLPIEHVEVDYGYLDDPMMDFFQYDMYALSWSIGRYPDTMWDLYSSANDIVPGGGNIPGVDDPELDALLNIVNFETNLALVKEAAFDAQDRLAELCASIPTITRSLTSAGVMVGDAAGSTDTLAGVVNMPGFGADTQWTMTNWRWESDPDGVGGTARCIIPSEPTNYHPGYASTTDEWLVMQNVVESLLEVNPYTHEDIPWIATDWDVDATYNDPISGKGMNMTFWLRDDVYFHDGQKFNATQAKWSLEFARDQQMSRAFAMYCNMTHIEIHDTYTYSIYLNDTSPWMIYDVAGWPAYFPKGCYEGTDRNFRPEATVNPYNPDLFCLVGTGPFVYRGGDIDLGGYVDLTAFRSPVSPVGDYHWWKTVEEWDAELAAMFHWIGDVGGDTPYDPYVVPPQQPPDGDIDIWDFTNAAHSYGLVTGEIWYNDMADINPEPTYHTNDGLVDVFDIAELSKNLFRKKRDYP